MKKVILLDSATFYPERISPYKVTMKKGEMVFLLDQEGEKVLLSISEKPTAGDARWFYCLSCQ
jgi:hypothetical protein